MFQEYRVNFRDKVVNIEDRYGFDMKGIEDGIDCIDGLLKLEK